VSRDLPQIKIYTDGSCSPNPGTGGWAAVIINDKGQSRTIKGGEEETTNNRMELTAALRALQDLADPHSIELFTDSRYLKDGITEWLANWQRRDWTTITGEDVKNRDLWQLLAIEIERHQISWNWVKGHGHDQWNILVDELASVVRKRPQLPFHDHNAVHIFLSITWRQKMLAGAWAGVMQYRNHYRVIGGVRREGTGNSLHIFSAISALRELKRALPVHIYTTSGYLKDGAGCWLSQWRRRDWCTREGLEVSNRREWQELEALLRTFSVHFHLVDKTEPPCHIPEAKEMAKEFFSVDFDL
jgi:ribonuclease HI